MQDKTVTKESEHIELRSVCSICGKHARTAETEGIDCCECSSPEQSSTLVCESDELLHNIDPQQHQEEFPDLGEQYEVLKLLGRGGMGSVYQVRDKSIDKVLAVKVLRSDLLTDAAASKRFAQEAKTAVGLTHANICAIYGFGQANNGTSYLVMNYLDGETLEQIIQREGVLSKQRALDIFIQVCEALAHAHMKGVLHRDIKPANIIITKTDKGADLVHLVDFGIAKMQEGDVRATRNLTQSGDIFGSPSYMSPEQCLGLALDNRSDIYSLGCVFYEALTGTKAFEGENPIQIIAQHLHESNQDRFTEQLHHHKVPEAFESVIARCLENDLDNRYESVDLVLKDLVSIRGGQKICLYKKKKPSTVVLSKVHVGVGAFAAVILVLAMLISVASTNGTAAGPTVLASWGVLVQVVGVIISGIFAIKGYAEKRKRNRTSFAQHTLLLGGTLFACCLVSLLPAAINNLMVVASFGHTGHYLSHYELPYPLVSSGWTVGIIAFVLAAISLTVSAVAYFVANVPRRMKFILLALLIFFGVCFKSNLASVPMFARALHQTAWMGMGRGYSTADHLPTELFLLNMAEWLNPNDPGILIENARMRGGAEAVKNYSRVISLNKDPRSVVEAYELRASNWQRAGKPDLALQDYAAAIKIEPGNSSLRLSQAQLHQQLGQPDVAIADLTAAIQEYAGNWELYYDRAQLLSSQNKPEQAVEDYNKALDLCDISQCYLPRIGRGLAYKKLDKTHLAAQDFASVSNNLKDHERYYPTDGKIRYYRAIAHKELGEMDKAKKEAEAARSLGYKASDWNQFGLK